MQTFTDRTRNSDKRSLRAVPFFMLVAFVGFRQFSNHNTNLTCNSHIETKP